ncbi:SRPBCC family protein [Streptomyces xanthii]|uniref:SRPBCC family protein n=1 Tax=Streptomyces xanthii TaxID=2768069 RepID=A0A7H1B3F8_9ACTN|nr:SRPBCC family protein [Streptomyces xanthii]QNS03263.1 SRPBCC family protein [Streptomyces xanthii]
MTDTRTDSALGGLAKSAAADHLKAELRDYLAVRAEHLLVGAGRKLGETTARLDDIADGKSPGPARLVLDGGRKLAEGKGPLRGALELGASRLKETVVETARNLTGKRGGGRKSGAGHRPTVILEYADVGVDLRTAYDQWTRFQDFSRFAKGVRSAERADDVTSDWQLKIFWSSRSWKAHVTEQIPDERIAWTSEGAKGTTKGVVSFHALGDRLTRVVLLVEYHPRGLFEKTGNLWRAQGRRTRLDLKHFARYVTLRGETQEEGWRGEIRDGEVVLSHEDAVADQEEPEDAEQEYGEEGEEYEERYEPEREGEEDDRDYEQDDGDEGDDEEYDPEEEPEDDAAEYEEAPR